MSALAPYGEKKYEHSLAKQAFSGKIGSHLTKPSSAKAITSKIKNLTKFFFIKLPEAF